MQEKKNTKELEKAKPEVFQDSSVSEWLIHLFQWKCSSQIDQRPWVHQALFAKPGRRVKRFSISSHLVGGLGTNESQKTLAFERDHPLQCTIGTMYRMWAQFVRTEESLAACFCAALPDGSDMSSSALFLYRFQILPSAHHPRAFTATALKAGLFTEDLSGAWMDAASLPSSGDAVQ